MHRYPRFHNTTSIGLGLALALAVNLAALAVTASPVAAASCGGQLPNSTLTAGGASPGSGITATAFGFHVTFTDTKGANGRPPGSVRLVVSGLSTTAMSGTGTDYKNGVVFTTSRTLPAGVWTYRFEAINASGLKLVCDLVDPPTITVVAPTPTPTPTPKPTPRPTPAPTPTATPKPTPKPTPRPTPKPTTKPSSGTPSPKPTHTPGSSGGNSTPRPSASGAGSTALPGPTPSPVADPFGGAGPIDAGPGGPWLGGILEGRTPIIAWTTTTLLGLFMFAWTLRRREDEQGSPLAAALTMVAAARGGGRRTQAASGDAAEPAAAVVGSVESAFVAADAGDPATLRGNRANGWRSRPALRFDRAAAKNVIRRQITYRLVRLSDGPDELRSREIMRLDRGDEIEIVADEGAILQVRTPSGEVGWIPGVSILG